ncbi:cysteine desulfurase family protein [Nitrosospira multiformis]|uniref:cysteine desulfurase family protein n=1 Tax=Nitrosospira multiformis TaxID=1231 RepID=UPI0008968E0B|nr:cysteine desulfurase family protein [Nitrosospira multiformis]SEA31984.1 cysteine desulfurase [Nitrosospira multiformis]
MTYAYFDHNATTAVDKAALDAMLPYFQEEYGNPSSRHAPGIAARRAVDRAREQVADAVGVQPSQVVFTSGGSEANNLFIQGAAGYMKPGQIAISAIEHPCVMKTAQELTRASRGSWNLRRLAVDNQGRLDLAALDEALSSQQSGLVSVMLANNETGVIQDVSMVGEKARARGAWIHTDAVQAFGKIPVDFASLNVHALTLSSHKICGPKGAAALIMDKRLLLKPLIYGGGHEGGLRSGTENVPAIVGFGVACELVKRRIAEHTTHISALRQQLERGLLEMGGTVFGLGASRLPNTCYFALPGIEGDTLVVRLDKAGFAVASGAACSSVNPGRSHVLEAMGVDPALARCAVRVSLGASNSSVQVADFLRALGAIVGELEQMSALSI